MGGWERVGKLRFCLYLIMDAELGGGKWFICLNDILLNKFPVIFLIIMAFSPSLISTLFLWIDKECSAIEIFVEPRRRVQSNCINREVHDYAIS